MNAKLSCPAAAVGLALALAAPPLFCQPVDFDRVQAQEDFRRGVRAFHNGLFSQSVLYLEKALSLTPADPLSRTWLGRAQYRCGLESAALQSWSHVQGEGAGVELLRSQAQTVEFRRGLGREMHLGPAGAALPDSRYVLAQSLDSSTYSSTLFRRPSSVRSRRDGSLFIVSFGSDEVLVADVNHDIREVWNGTWKGNLRGFDQPFDVLETDDGSVFVSEYGANRIARRAPGGAGRPRSARRDGGPGNCWGRSTWPPTAGATCTSPTGATAG